MTSKTKSQGREFATAALLHFDNLAELLSRIYKQGSAVRFKHHRDLLSEMLPLIQEQMRLNELRRGLTSVTRVRDLDHSEKNQFNEVDVLPKWFWNRWPKAGAYTPEAKAEFRQRYKFLTPSDDPKVIGCLEQYTLLREIGFGGMGVVFEARATKSGLDGHLCAIKVIQPYIQNRHFTERFDREAGLMKKLSDTPIPHSHIVRILEYQNVNCEPHLVMDYICGPTLQDLLDALAGCPCPESFAIDLTLQIARGLLAAHVHVKPAITHRDLKPANILLQPVKDPYEFPYGWLVKVGDFGLAAPIEGSELTRSNMEMGTDGYKSPEQCEPGAEVGPESDIFVLGIILYQLVTGRHPFDVGTPQKARYQIAFPLLRTPRGDNPDITVALNNLILKLFERRPDDRVETGKLVKELQSLWEAPAHSPNTCGEHIRPAYVAGGLATPTRVAGESGSQGSPQSVEYRDHRKRVYDHIAVALANLKPSVLGLVTQCVSDALMEKEEKSYVSQRDLESDLAMVIIDVCPALSLLEGLNGLMANELQGILLRKL